MPDDAEHNAYSALLGSVHRGGLIALKRDGRPQISTVDYTYDPEARIVRVSTTDDRAKVRNLRRDPRVSLFVTTADGSSYAVAEGTAELSPVSAAPDDATVEELIVLYRGVNGEHPDWDEYRDAMVADRRLVIRIHIARFYGYIRPA